MEDNSHIPLSQAVEAIKTAILQGQYEALKDVNRVQLAVYFAIGKYLSKNTRKGVWGTGALKKISEQLRKELPGLRGYSETQLRDMRRFYEAWIVLDGDAFNRMAETMEDFSAVTNAESLSPNSAVATAKLLPSNSAVKTAELQASKNQIDIFHAITIPNIAEFPIEDFLNVPFTHHSRLIMLCKDTEARYYYIRRAAEEHLSVEALEKLIKQKHSKTEKRFRTTSNKPYPIPPSPAKP